LAWRGWISIIVIAAICGLNGAGSALASPMGFCAAVRVESAASTANAEQATTNATGMKRLRIFLSPDS
jgi:hypothetical protein